MNSLPFVSMISLRGCREHNLKNLAVSLPKQAITVLTGVSGSGKSSLAFDTLFAEGQRRYLEYLFSQTRNLIKQVAKPAVDSIEGLSPTLAVGQRSELSARGTLATYTDIYDFLTLLFATVGEQHSPITGKRLIRYSRQEMINLLLKEFPQGTKLQILSPVKLSEGKLKETMNRLQQMGFARFKINNQEWTNEDPIPEVDPTSPIQLDVIIDRLEIKEGIRDRLATSLETALDLSQGVVKVQEGRNGPIRFLTEIYVCPETSLSFAPLEPADFNFNSIRGACKVCEGRGGREEIEPTLLFPDPDQLLRSQVQTILDHLPRKIKSTFEQILHHFMNLKGISDEAKVADIPPNLLKEFLFGSTDSFEFRMPSTSEYYKTTWQGLIPFLNRMLREKKIKESFREQPCVQWKICPECRGGRLKPESLACLVHGKNISQVCQLTVDQMIQEMETWHFAGKEALITQEIIPAIQTRLHLLQQVGLGYLELNRQGNTLSAGEAQRVTLASQIGAKLSGIIYILDEPSLGLHRQDIKHLQHVIQELKQLDNTIVMVEHEAGLISHADFVVELGPGAGRHGGHITFQGTYPQLLDNPHSLTGQWLSGKKKFPKPPKRKPNKEWLLVKNASLHNLNQFSVKIPLGCLVGFCGVSGSGKSTLAIDLIATQLRQFLTHDILPSILENYTSIRRLVVGEKRSERFSARSIPATYVGVMNPLRQLFAETKLAKARGYTAARFSINKKGGRCEACEGLGQLQINMELMPDLFIPCDVCQGTRFNFETLQVTWEHRNISEVLDFSVDDAAKFFRHIPQLSLPLEMMQELGLGYLTLGQPFNTLSGGEIQRLKLVTDLISKNVEPTLYILDEPSAGLHFEDIAKLLKILHRLVDQGHSIIVLEHHLGLLQQADWLIELGPGGGPLGGELIFEGTPKQLLHAGTPTGRVLAQ